jgi:hypothetical protein
MAKKKKNNNQALLPIKILSIILEHFEDFSLGMVSFCFSYLPLGLFGNAFF